MSDLSNLEKRMLEKDLGMASGYVLDFSNRTFSDFFLDVLNIDIYDEKYDLGSGSKAYRMRAFWDVESNHTVSRILDALLKGWSEYAGFGDNLPSENFSQITQRLKSSAPVPDISVIRASSEEKGFDALARAVRESIEKNEPATGLDRLHTYLTKYFRFLCQKHGIATSKEKPLHSLVGEYIKTIKSKGMIESDITERILKSSISVLEAFNKIRNNHSFAHDNEILNYHESLLIFGHVTSLVRFIESIEDPSQESKQADPIVTEDIPF